MDNKITNEVSVQGTAASQELQGLQVSNAFAKLEKLDQLENTGIDLNKKYLEFEKKGEKKRFIVFNFGEWVNAETGELYSTVELLGADKKVYFTVSTVIVNSLKNAPIGTAIEITFEGEQKLSGGRTYKAYSLEMLK
jgi:hypothetical protein